MNIELTPIEPTPQVQHQILINGKSIGKLEFVTYSSKQIFSVLQP